MDKKYELYQYFTDITKTQKRPLKSTMIIIDIENECVVAALNELNEPVPSDFYIPNPNEQFYNKFNDFLFGECSAEEVENCRKICSTKLLLDTETNEIEMKNITKQHDTGISEIEMNEMLKQTKAETDEIEMNNTKQFDTENNEVKIATIVEQIKAETDEIEMNNTKQFDTENNEVKIDTITKHFENNEVETNKMLKQTGYVLSKESEYNPYKYTYDVPFVKNKRLIHDLPYYYHNRFTYLDDHTILPVQPKFVAIEYKSRTIFYDWEGPVPTDPIAPYTDSPAIRYIKSILDDYPVIGQKHISLSVDEYHKATGNTIKITNLKKSLPFLCYYMKNGPFAKCWIKFGYDPRLDKDCYKYQRIMKYKLNNKTNFIFEDPKLLAEIERNKNSLLRSTFCNNQGWFREELINYMKSYFKKKSLQKLTS